MNNPLSRLDRILAGLALARWMQVLLLIFEIPPLWSHLGWYFHHGGDQKYYFEFAQKLAAGQFDKMFAVQVGFPAVLALGIRLTGAQTFEALLPYVVILMGFILGAASVFLVGRSTYSLLGSEALAIGSAALWAFAPWWLWLLLGLHPSEAQMRGPYVPMVAWLQAIPDGITTFVLLLSFYYCVRVMRATNRWRAGLWALPLALAAGLVLLLRVQQVTALVLLLAVLLVEKRWFAAVLLLLGIVGLYQLQVYYMHRYAVLNESTSWLLTWLPPNFYFGTVSIQTNQINWNLLPIVMDFGAIPTFLWQKIRQAWMLLPLGLVAIFPLLLWLAVSWRQLGKGVTVLLFGMPIAAIGLLLFSPIYLESFYRYSIPAMPFLCILAVWAVQFFWQTVRRWRLTFLQKKV